MIGMSPAGWSGRVVTGGAGGDAGAVAGADERPGDAAQREHHQQQRDRRDGRRASEPQQDPGNGRPEVRQRGHRRIAGVRRASR